MQIIKKYWKRALFSLFLLLTVLLSPHLISSWKTYRTNKQFEQYTDELFFADVQGNALNLHYTLAAPEKLGITDYPVSLGNFDPSQISSRTLLWESRKSALEKFPSERLSQQNRLTKDILCLASFWK